MPGSISEIAGALFRSGCLKFGAFRVKSGALSPYYIDLSCLLSSPADFCCIVKALVSKIESIGVNDKLDKLASIELKGALLLPSVACQLDLPCIIVRKKEKQYGVTGRIAGGGITKGEHILFFDDVATDGTSKLDGIKPLEKLGAHVKNVMVVVDREQDGKQNLEKLGYKFHALTTISELVKFLLESSYITKEHMDAVLKYVKSP